MPEATKDNEKYKMQNANFSRTSLANGYAAELLYLRNYHTGVPIVMPSEGGQGLKV